MDTHNTLRSLLDDWALWQQAQGLSARTITERAAVVSHLVADSGDNPLEIAPMSIIRYTARAGLTASSRATYHASIRAYSRWLQRVGLRVDDPTLMTPTPKRPKGAPRPISGPQLERLLDVVNRRRTRAMVLLGALAGLRVHEIAKVHGDDFDLDGGVLTVTGKGGKTAMIPLHPRLIEEARDWPRAGYWFPAYGGREGPIRGTSVGAAIADAMSRAGINATAHQLRHWYGTGLVEAGNPTLTVQVLMRHESPATTAIYGRVSTLQLREAINSLPFAA